MSNSFYNYLLLNQKKIIYSSLFLITFVWAVTASIGLLIKKDEFMLVENDPSIGLRKLDSVLDSKEPESSILNFLNSFVIHSFNNTPENALKNASISSEYLSEALWTQTKTRVLDEVEKIRNENIFETGQLVSASQEGGDYLITVKVRKVFINPTNRNDIGKDSNETIKLKVRLKRASLRKDNMWGVEIDKIDSFGI